jgi:hypothetical protein
MSLFTLLEHPPLFTLTRSVPEPSPVSAVFANWPAEKAQLLRDAQAARDKLSESCKSKDSTLRMRLDAANAYLAIAIAIEKVKAETPTIQVNGDRRLKWLQSPIVIRKYIERSFSGLYWNVEVLHLIWLRAVTLLDQASLHLDDGSREPAVTALREVAGIFHYLASDRLRSVTSEEVPVEFQPPVFNSFMSLALGQAYAIIASKGENDGVPPQGLGKLCFTIFATFSSALDSIQTAKPPELIQPQYVNWIKGAKAFFHGAAAIYIAFVHKAKNEIGKAIGLIRLGIADLESIPAIDRLNGKLNQEAVAIVAKAKGVEPGWTQANFRISSEVVPQKEEAEQLLSASCTVVANLPQPIPFVPPELAETPSTA